MMFFDAINLSNFNAYRKCWCMLLWLDEDFLQYLSDWEASVGAREKFSNQEEKEDDVKRRMKASGLLVC